MSGRTREIITGYVGPMFGSKSLLLLHQISAAEAVGEDVAVFKPAVDNRYGPTEIRSRAGGCHSAMAVNFPVEIAQIVMSGGLKPNLVAIDEAQFFSKELTQVVLYLAENGIQVAYSALNTNYRGEPFGPVPQLLAISTELQMVSARCTYPSGNGSGRRCGAEAKFTQRMINGEPADFNGPEVVIEIPGETEVSYEARCPDHWFVPGLPQRIRLSDLK